MGNASSGIATISIFLVLWVRQSTGGGMDVGSGSLKSGGNEGLSGSFCLCHGGGSLWVPFVLEIQRFRFLS